MPSPVVTVESWAAPQLLRRRAGPSEQEVLAAHAQRDGNAADGALPPAARADVPGVAHPIARAHETGGIAPLQRQRIDAEQRGRRTLARAGPRIRRPAPVERLGGACRRRRQRGGSRGRHGRLRSLRSLAQ